MNSPTLITQDNHHLGVMENAVVSLLTLSELLSEGEAIDAQATAKELHDLAADLFHLTFPDASFDTDLG